MTGQIYSLAKYQAGCRFLQKQLDENSAAAAQIIFKEIFPHVVELMTDPYGQYLIPKLVQRCEVNDRKVLVKKIGNAPIARACVCARVRVLMRLQRRTLWISLATITEFTACKKSSRSWNRSSSKSFPLESRTALSSSSRIAKARKIAQKSHPRVLGRS
jgi:hypothetical protein